MDLDVVEDDFDDDPHPASATARPTVASKVRFLSMVLMMSDWGTPFPTVGALDLL